MTSTDFPIPADLEGFWQWDQLHCPRPLTHLEHELLLASTGYGFSKAIWSLSTRNSCKYSKCPAPRRCNTQTPSLHLKRVSISVGIK